MNNELRVLVGCEYSGRVRSAFRAMGCDAWSCDLLESEDNSEHHIVGDVTELLNDSWDLAIFHPPCTHLAVSGARHFAEKIADGRQQAALDFVRLLMNAPIQRIAIENPISIISSKIRKPDQIIQPYMFGDPYMKTTCLWLKGLAKLTPTNIVDGREQKCWKEPPSPDRWKNRSRTYPGIARAMAHQWSCDFEMYRR